MGSKQKCQYWEKCFRKDKRHLGEFLHPDQNSPQQEKGDGTDIHNKKIVFIGNLKTCSFTTAVSRAKAFGCSVENHLSKKIDLVIVGEEADDREVKAQEIGLKCLTEDQWESLLKKSKPANKKAVDNDDARPSTSLGRKNSLRKSTSSTASLKRKNSSSSSPSPALERRSSLRRRSTLELPSTSDEPEVKPKSKERKTHEISFLDTDSAPELKKKNRKRSSADQEDADELSAKKIKLNKKTSSSSDTKLKVKVPNTSPKLKGKKVKCKYWNKCYRKEANHKKQFLHPGDPVPEDENEDEEDDSGLKRTRASTRPKPKNKIEDGDVHLLEGGAYTLKRVGSHYYCTCSGWKNQNKPINKRTCKHLKDHLGDDYESVRCQMTKVQKAKGIPSHIQVNVLLAHKYEGSNVNPKGWWMSEKLDGVRAFWNGRCFYSRLGNAFLAPHWFTKDLPVDMHLDGELFGGRGKFQSTVSIVKNGQGEEAWKKIKYFVFDAPHIEKQPFEKRIAAIQEYFDENQPQYAVNVEQEKCKGKEQVEEELKRVIKLGGEGLMIREPGSKYERRRSHTLLKIKKFYDAEAIVIGYEPGKGRFHNAVGALRCKMACGKIFKVGSGMTDKDHHHPPKVGTIITYKFQEYSNSGSPRFPTYLGIRIDMDKPKDADVPKKPADA
ncbi:hypothetical protein ScPMuIL_001952 [Solemya velum]